MSLALFKYHLFINSQFFLVYLKIYFKTGSDSVGSQIDVHYIGSPEMHGLHELYTTKVLKDCSVILKRFSAFLFAQMLVHIHISTTVLDNRRSKGSNHSGKFSLHPLPKKFKTAKVDFNNF